MEYTLLFIDVETTGLIGYPIDTIYLDRQPHILQVSWIGCNSDLTDVYQENYLVKPENFILNREVFEMHKRKYLRAKEIGIPIESLLNIIETKVLKSDVIVGHNISFEKDMIDIESQRYKLETSMGDKLLMCMMHGKTQFGKHSFNRKHLRPTLEALSVEVLGKKLIKKQNSIENVKTIFNIFCELNSLGRIKL